MNWYVVYTKPKWEKKVAARLNEIGIVCYCPIITKVSQWSDRKKMVHVPLFNSYVFVNIGDNDRNKVFDVAGTVRYLFWLGKPAIIKDQEIDIIKNWLQTPNALHLVVEKWKKGDKVVLASGPFATQTAVVQEVNAGHCILVLESLGCVLKVAQNNM